MSVETIPEDIKQLRACMLCSLVKKHEQFFTAGCENCEKHLKMKGSDVNIAKFTSVNFQGMIGMMHPDGSWVAKWQRIDRFVPGMYAISVTGCLSALTLDHLESIGVQCRRRDTSVSLR